MRRARRLAVLIVLSFGLPASRMSAQPQAIKPQLVKSPSVVEVKAITGPIGKSVVLEARLISGKGELLGGKTLNFSVATKNLGSFETSSGSNAAAGLAKAPFTITADYPPGAYEIEVRFAGDERALSCIGRSTLTVIQGSATIDLEPVTEYVHFFHDFVVNGELINAVDLKPIGERPLTLSMNGIPAGNVTSSAQGRFRHGLRAPVFWSAGTDSTNTLNVEVGFAGDPFFAPARATLAITVFGPQPPPVITSVEPAKLTEGKMVGFVIHGSDLYPAGMDPNDAFEYKDPGLRHLNRLQVLVNTGNGYWQCPVNGWSDSKLRAGCVHDCFPPDVKVQVLRNGEFSNIFIVPVKKNTVIPAVIK